MYGHGRNSVESFNAYLKDGGNNALEDGSPAVCAARWHSIFSPR
ncbi:hypothetical protein OYT00_03140 [Microbacterium paraoxydans]|nr:hypothetical protein [Microbacterium paraoxydans]MCZ0708982.1 hypothetical protein [Microbacterium paraoxydans]